MGVGQESCVGGVRGGVLRGVACRRKRGRITSLMAVALEGWQSG
jgi:hypothetical protein